MYECPLNHSWFLYVQIAGASVVDAGSSNGYVKVFDVDAAAKAGVGGTSDTLLNVSVVPGNTAVFVAWQKEINHIAVGCGDCVTRLLYDPAISKKGCMLSSVRVPKRCVLRAVH